MKRLLFFLLFAATGYSQTPAVISHAASSVTGGSVTLSTTGAKAIAVCAAGGSTVSDHSGNRYYMVANQGATGTNVSAYVAFGITTSASEVISVSGGDPFTVLTFSNISARPDVTAGANGPAYPQTVGPITPTRGQEMVFGCSQVVKYGAGLSPTVNSQYTLGDVTAVASNSHAMMDAYAVYSSSTPSGSFTCPLLPQTVSSSANSINFCSPEDNGEASVIVALYSAADPLPLTIPTTSLPAVMRGNVYPSDGSNCVVVKGGNSPYTITETGTLPVGITFDPIAGCFNGTASGGPSDEGNHAVTIHVTDSASHTVNSTGLGINVQPQYLSLDSQAPTYGWRVHTGAQRNISATVTGPPALRITDRFNFTVTEGSGYATMSCSSNCVGLSTITVTAPEAACSVTGGSGTYVIAGGTTFHLVVSAVDANEDGSHTSSTQVWHTCTGGPTVGAKQPEIEPAYNQAYFHQMKLLAAYVPYRVVPNVTWSCKAPDNSDCGSMLTSTTDRIIGFTAGTTIGRYTITATDALDGTLSQHSTIYVGGAAPAVYGSKLTTPTNTEITACFPDPAFGSRSWTVKQDGTGDFTHIWQLPTGTGGAGLVAGGFLGRVFNLDTTGSHPTTYADYWQIATSGSRDLPVYICGVPDAVSGHNPQVTARNSTTGDGSTWEGNSVWVLPVGSSSGGYAQGSAGPDYWTLTGLDFVCNLCNGDQTPGHLLVGGVNDSYNNNYTAVSAGGGRHGHIEGVSADRPVNGFFFGNNTQYSGRRYSDFNSVFGSAVTNWGAMDSQGYHATYAQQTHPLFLGNHFGSALQPSTTPDGVNHDGASGEWVKNRGGDGLYAFNSFVGFTGGPTFYLGAGNSDPAAYVAADINMGLPGDTACDMPYCLDGADHINISELTDHEEQMAHDFFLFNFVDNWTPATLFQYSDETVHNDCDGHWSWCSNMEDHSGKLYFVNNTIKRQFDDIGQTGNVFVNSQVSLPIFSWPRVLYQNNSFWTDVPHMSWTIDNVATAALDFKTNMFAPGQIDITAPINTDATAGPTSKGWGVNVGGSFRPWTNWQHKEEYTTGLTSGNFLTSATEPYNGRTGAPLPGSPLIGAGSALTDPQLAHFPTIFQADVINGWITTRTNPLTIGAIDAGPNPTPTAFTLTPTPYTITPNGGSCSNCLAYNTIWPDGLVEQDTIRAYNWRSSDNSKVIFGLSSQNIFTPQSGVTSGSGTFSADYNGNTAVASWAFPGSGTTLSATTSSLPSGVAGTSYSTNLAAIGGTAPYTWTRTGGTLPSALTLNGSTGVISGTPAAAGTTTGLIFTVTDSVGATASTAALSLAVTAPPTLTVTTTSLPAGQVGTTYTATSLTATGGTPPYTWVRTDPNPFPPGLNFSGSTISGIPVAAATYSGLVWRVTDSVGNIATSPTFSITIAPHPAPTVTTTTLPNGTVGAAYSGTLTATGGTAPYTWALTTGALPFGLSLNTSTGVITGTPTTAGTATGLVFRATDLSAATGNSPSLSITIAPAPTGNGSATITGTVTITGGGVVIQ